MQALPPTQHVNRYILAPSEAMAMSGNVLPIAREPLQEKHSGKCLAITSHFCKTPSLPTLTCTTAWYSVSVSSHLVLPNIKLYLMYFCKPLCGVLASSVPHPSAVPAYGVKGKEEPPSRAYTWKESLEKTSSPS